MYFSPRAGTHNVIHKGHNFIHVVMSCTAYLYYMRYTTVQFVFFKIQTCQLSWSWHSGQTSAVNNLKDSMKSYVVNNHGSKPCHRNRLHICIQCMYKWLAWEQWLPSDIASHSCGLSVNDSAISTQMDKIQPRGPEISYEQLRNFKKFFWNEFQQKFNEISVF